MPTTQGHPGPFWLLRGKQGLRIHTAQPSLPVTAGASRGQVCRGGSPHRARPGARSLPRTSPLHRPVPAVPQSPPQPFSVVCPEQMTEHPPHSPSSRKFPVLSLLHSSCCSQGLRSFPVLPFTCLDISSSPVQPPQPTPLPPSLPCIGRHVALPQAMRAGVEGSRADRPNLATGKPQGQP